MNGVRGILRQAGGKLKGGGARTKTDVVTEGVDLIDFAGIGRHERFARKTRSASGPVAWGHAD